MHCDTLLPRFRVSPLVLLLSAVLVSSSIGRLAVAQPTVGLISYDPDSTYDGYTLVSPFASDTTYLIDMWGRVVHSWDTDASPLNQAYLLADGTLVKAQNGTGSSQLEAPGSAGAVRKYSWAGALEWDFNYKSDSARAHHDIEPLPNGNVLMIAWEFKTEAEYTAHGGDIAALDTTIWPGHVIEVEKTGATTGNIVWEWHMWDHVIQDFDGAKPNFGVVSQNPQLIDLNKIFTKNPDWAHLNGIDYNPILDQIALSSPNFNETWIIDHSTTTAEAAGHTGGNSGMGGDLLYRWGNPSRYDRGSSANQKLYFQHDARWIEPGLPGAGNMLVFNNRNPGGDPGPDGDFSTVDEWVTPDSGLVYKKPAPTFLPADFLWSYEAVPPTDFSGRALSGAQRLPNGNTLICNGAQGTVFEVTPSGSEVWRWKSPVITGGTIVTQGTAVTTFTNLLFKCDRYPGGSGALAGRDLTPGSTIEGGTAQTAALVSPADSALNVSTLPTFTWSAATNATSYGIQVSSDPGFSNLVVDQAGIAGTSYSVTSKTAAALPGGIYYWKVQSSNGFGVGAPSETRIFSTTESLAEQVAVSAKIFLEGPYTAGSHSAPALFLNAVPLTQPYGSTEYVGTSHFYDGADNFTSRPANAVDWVRLSLRTALSSDSVVATRAGLVLQDGSITDVDGTSAVVFDSVSHGEYYLTVRHRNHISIMSSGRLDLNSGTGSWDFTDSLEAAYTPGPAPMKDLGSGDYGMYACDISHDGQITALDFNSWLVDTKAVVTGYVTSDCSLDGQTTTTDFNLWLVNTKAVAASQVPE